MYLETLQAMVDAKVNSRLDYQKYWDRALKRAQKFALILERFISPEGTFPVLAAARLIVWPPCSPSPSWLGTNDCHKT